MEQFTTVQGFTDYYEHAFQEVVRHNNTVATAHKVCLQMNLDPRCALRACIVELCRQLQTLIDEKKAGYWTQPPAPIHLHVTKEQANDIVQRAEAARAARPPVHIPDDVLQNACDALRHPGKYANNPQQAPPPKGNDYAI